ncbi:MAG: zinc ABC transporter substrate-binding protein [Acidothermales bacterium]|nr:zinc ABC transporter substrate-binding protein [Acidothermales bacterium]
MRRWLPPFMVLSIIATGCGAEPSSSPDASGTADTSGGGEAVQAVAAVYPLAWVAGQVAPDAEVELLNQGGQEAHDIEISPPQRAGIETADVVLYTGDIDYQPQVEDAVSAAQGEVVSAAEVAGEDALLAASADAHAHDGEEGHDDHGNEGESGGIDPHLWFDPTIMAELAVAVGEAFAAADPNNAETYQQNASGVRDDMALLGEDLDATLGGDCGFDEAIVSHAAYAYLLEPYGKTQHAVTNVGAEADASAGELAEIVGEIRTEGFTHVLAEPVEGREGAVAVATEADVELLEIVPLDAVTEEQAATGLPDLIRAQAEAFATALGCE